MDEIRSEYRVARIKKALRENYRAGKIADNIDLLNDELRYFPENAELLFELGRSLCLAHVDEQGELAQMFGIESIPTLAVVQDRHTLTGSVGLRSKEEIKAMLDGCK